MSLALLDSPASQRSEYVLWESHLHMVLGCVVHEEHPVGARLLDHAGVQRVPVGIFLRRLGVAVDEAGESRGRIWVGSRNSVEDAADGDRGNGNPEA